jgi:hypothetical protein
VIGPPTESLPFEVLLARGMDGVLPRDGNATEAVLSVGGVVYVRLSLLSKSTRPLIRLRPWPHARLLASPGLSSRTLSFADSAARSRSADRPQPHSFCQTPVPAARSVTWYGRGQSICGSTERRLVTVQQSPLGTLCSRSAAFGRRLTAPLLTVQPGVSWLSDCYVRFPSVAPKRKGPGSPAPAQYRLYE